MGSAAETPLRRDIPDYSYAEMRWSNFLLANFADRENVPAAGEKERF
jgi:hypothetical protein